MLFRPALDHNLLLGVELDRVAALSVHYAEKTLFPPAERKIGHGRGYADVDPYISCRRFVTETARGRAAGREQRCLVSIRVALQKGERLVRSEEHTSELQSPMYLV